VEKDYFAAAACAMATMGIAGEMAAAIAAGPGSLQINFLDNLYRLSKDEINRRLKIED
jgi:hydroxyethylthiazole kinase